MIGQYLGHKLELLNHEELAELRRVYKSICDGQSSREEHFSFPETSGEAQTVNDKLKAKAAAIKQKNQAPAGVKQSAEKGGAAEQLTMGTNNNKETKNGSKKEA
jgi:hypothetical protein